MSEPTDQAHRSAHQVALLAELLDLLWEQARHESPPPLIPAQQLRVMSVIDNHNGIPMRDLTRRLGSSAPSVSRLVDRLQALGYVERHPHPDSAREVTLTLTRPGHTHLTRVREHRERLLVQALETLPAEQSTALSTALGHLNRALAPRPGPPHAVPLVQAVSTAAPRSAESRTA
ncbi:MarR family transcriptional regulator [Streptomyces sp. NPDC052225]|uniref:MarR family winged helix-turn-helix transcriptional regulator n=1 Tax=Streptomyces sp. NPDC052225 TaxID=3154949 RepID=UPI00341BFE32